MNVYLSACGMGVGHIIRCERIAQALTARGAGIIYSTYSDGEHYAASKKLSMIETVPLSLCMNDEGAVDFRRTAATHPGFFRGIWLIIKQIVVEMRNIQACRPDVVISDSRVSSILASKIMRVPTVLILNQYSIYLSKSSHRSKESAMDRLFFVVANFIWTFVRVIIGEFWALSDRIIIPDMPPPNTVSIRNLAFPKRHLHKVSYVGPFVNSLNCAIHDGILARKELGLNEGKPILFVPVSMPHSVRAPFIETFEGILSQMEDYEIVLSRCMVGGAQSPIRRANMLIYDWIDDPSCFFSACDVVVCRAGHGTITTAISFGKPMDRVPIPNHPEQMANGMRASDLGIAKVLSQFELTAKRLDSVVKELLSDERYSRRVSEMRKIACELDGIKSVVALIEALSVMSPRKSS